MHPKMWNAKILIFRVQKRRVLDWYNSLSQCLQILRCGSSGQGLENPPTPSCLSRPVPDLHEWALVTRTKSTVDWLKGWPLAGTPITAPHQLENDNSMAVPSLPGQWTVVWDLWVFGGLVLFSPEITAKYQMVRAQMDAFSQKQFSPHFPQDA